LQCLYSCRTQPFFWKTPLQIRNRFNNRQREWRIVQGKDPEPERFTPLSTEMKATLLSIDNKFFKKEIEVGAGIMMQRIEFSSLLKKINGIPSLNAAKRIIVPSDKLEDVKALLSSHEDCPEIVSIESLA